MPDLYVFTVETDHPGHDDGRPIVWEQNLDGEHASLENVKKHVRVIGDKYGKIRIAKLVFIDEESTNAE